MSAEVLRPERDGKCEDLVYGLYGMQKVVRDEIRVAVMGQIMGLNKRTIYTFIYKLKISRRTQNYCYRVAILWIGIRHSLISYFQ